MLGFVEIFLGFEERDHIDHASAIGSDVVLNIGVLKVMSGCCI
jgi:hypothetical protein